MFEHEISFEVTIKIEYFFLLFKREFWKIELTTVSALVRDWQVLHFILIFIF